MTNDHHSGSNHWDTFARIWDSVGPPLRPAPEDLAIITSRVIEPRGGSIDRVAIFGVTPEFTRLPWLPGTKVFAVDHNQAMIDHVWPGDPDGAYCAEWTDTPLDSNSVDVVLCDGGMTLLEYPLQHELVVSELSRIVRPGGIVMLRLYVGSDPPEDPRTILADVTAGKAIGVNHLKLRLWTGLGRDPRECLRLHQVWQTLEDSIGVSNIAEITGWPKDHVDVLNLYRDNMTRYCFPSVEQITELFCSKPGGFTRSEVIVPGYPVGEHSPFVMFRRLPGV